MIRNLYAFIYAVTIAAGLAFLVTLSGCSTSASMRIEVEVYKGPLSTNTVVQYGELLGVIDAGLESFQIFLGGATVKYHELNCPANKKLANYCDTLKGVIDPTETLIADIRSRISNFRKKTEKYGEIPLLSVEEQNEFLVFARYVSEYATQFQAKAFF